VGSDRIAGLIARRLPELSRPLRRNLALAVAAMVAVLAGLRSGNGRLSLSAIARAWPLSTPEKARKKRFWRFLAHRGLTPEALVPALVRLVVGEKAPPLVPLVVDTTWVGPVAVLAIGVVAAGRVLPVAFSGYLPPSVRRSQNRLETALISLVLGALPAGSRGVVVGDRAFGRAQLLSALGNLGAAYVLRARGKVTVTIDGRATLIRRLRSRPGRPRRLVGALYHGEKRIPVDLVVYRDPAFREPWYLVVPPESENDLPTDEVVRLYRERMCIEQGFRDWKTHLGARGLVLRVDPAARLTRLLLAMNLAYLLAVLLGAGPLGQRLRSRLETPRLVARHGTRRTLSAYSRGALLLGLASTRRWACAWLARVLAKLTRGVPALALCIDSS
jgi:hypothetical protein